MHQIPEFSKIESGTRFPPPPEAVGGPRRQVGAVAPRRFAAWRGVAAPVQFGIGLTVVVCVPFVAFLNLVLNHFYVHGSFVWDTGLLASLMWHSNLALTLPACVGDSSFFAVHFVPVFLLLSTLSWMLPLSLPQFYSAFIGLDHVLLALAVFLVLTRGFGLQRGARLWLAVLLALAFAFNGLALAIVRYPHFETLLVAAFLLSLVARALHRPYLGAGLFLLGLMTREDAGLHYAAILAVSVATRWFCGEGLRSQRSDMIYIGVGLLYAASALLVQHLAFHSQSSFVQVYLGSPPFSRLSLPLLQARIAFFVANRAYIWLPGLAAICLAVFTRQIHIAVGYIACLPWLLLNLLAASDMAGTFSSYYAFPFLIALGWPLAGALQQDGQQGRALHKGKTIAAFAGLLALTFVPSGDLHDPGHLRIPQDFLRAPSWTSQRATDGAVAALVAVRPELGRIVADNSVGAIAPNGFRAGEVPYGDPSGVADTVAYFTHGYGAPKLAALARSEHLTHRYIVPGTELHLASRSDLRKIPRLAKWLLPEGDGEIGQ